MPAMRLKLATDFFELDFSDSGLFLSAFSEFTVATMKRSLKWKKDAENLRRELQPLLLTLLKDHGEAFANPLLAEIKRVGKTLQVEIHSLIPRLAEFEEDTLSTPCPTGGGDTRRRLDETILKQDINENKTKTYTGDFDTVPQTTNRERLYRINQCLEMGMSSKAGFKPASEAAKNSALARGIG